MSVRIPVSPLFRTNANDLRSATLSPPRAGGPAGSRRGSRRRNSSRCSDTIRRRSTTRRSCCPSSPNGPSSDDGGTHPARCPCASARRERVVCRRGKMSAEKNPGKEAATGRAADECAVVGESTGVCDQHVLSSSKCGMLIDTCMWIHRWSCITGANDLVGSLF